MTQPDADALDSEPEIREVDDGDEPEDGLELWTSDAVLSPDEAEAAITTRGATVCLFMGEAGTGKTTLLVEAWTELMEHGSVGGLRFGGSRNPLAFEQRAFESRLSSNRPTGDTLRTAADDDGFLHLSLAKDTGERVDLLLADVAGEHFTRVRQGAPLAEEIWWLSRADKLFVLLDGTSFASRGSREIAVNRAQRLLLAIASSEHIDRSASVCLLLTKADALENDEDYVDTFRRLVTFADDRGVTASSLRVAARPRDGSAPVGLTELLVSMAEKSGASGSGPADSDPPASLGTRAIERFGI